MQQGYKDTRNQASDEVSCLQLSFAACVCECKHGGQEQRQVVGWEGDVLQPGLAQSVRVHMCEQRVLDSSKVVWKPGTC